MDGELEDILDWLLLLLLNLLAILSLVLFYSIALSFCAVALHICGIAISLPLVRQLRRHVAYLELSSHCPQPCFSQTFVERETEKGEQRANERAMSKDIVQGKNEYNTRSYMLHELVIHIKSPIAQIFVHQRRGRTKLRQLPRLKSELPSVPRSLARTSQAYMTRTCGH